MRWASKLKMRTATVSSLGGSASRSMTPRHGPRISAAIGPSCQWAGRGCECQPKSLRLPANWCASRPRGMAKVRVHAPELFERRLTWRTPKREAYLRAHVGVDPALLAIDLGVTERTVRL